MLRETINIEGFNFTKIPFSLVSVNKMAYQNTARHNIFVKQQPTVDFFLPA